MNIFDYAGSLLHKGANAISDVAEDTYNIINTKSDEDVEHAKLAFRSAQRRFGEERPSGQLIGRYLSKSGLDYDVPAKEIRKNGSVAFGESKNQTRLLDSLLEPKKLRKKKIPIFFGSDYREGEYSLEDMKDGEIFGVDDYFDHDASASLNPLYTENPFVSTHPEAGKALGSYKLRSKSNLQFIKSGEKILPYGYVDHSIEDRYDFHEGARLLGDTGVLLEEKGEGKPFMTRVNWKTRPYGVIRLNNGKIDATNIEWE